MIAALIGVMLMALPLDVPVELPRYLDEMPSYKIEQYKPATGCTPGMVRDSICRPAITKASLGVGVSSAAAR